MNEKTLKRCGIGLILYFQCLLAFLLVSVIAEGEFSRPLVFYIGVAGGLFGVSCFITIAIPLTHITSLVTHGALLLGSFLFMFPFAWLLITSFKYPEEIVTYPPRWIPTVPNPRLQSPYVADDLLKERYIPEPLEVERWENLYPSIEFSLWEYGVQIIPKPLLRVANPEELRLFFCRGLWNTIAPGMPSHLWQETDEVILLAVKQRMTVDRAEDVWNMIYRCVAFRSPFFTNMDHSDFPITIRTEELLVHHVRTNGEAHLTCQHSSIQPSEPAIVVAYNLAKQPTVTIEFELPLPINSRDLMSITVPLRQDRTWHRMAVDCEFDGRHYECPSALFLTGYRWQEFTFKLADRDPTDERNLGIWPLYPTHKTSKAFHVPGKVLFRLHLIRSTRVGAMLNKYIQNYRNAWRVGAYWDRYIINSLYLVVLTIAGQLVSCSVAAYAFARLRWPGRDVLFFILLATMMLPGQVTMIPVFMVFRALGWYNTLKPLWVPAFTGAPFFIFLLRQFMKAIPRDIEDAALIDGCGYAGIYTRIILPLIKPALAAVGIFTFMGTWNEFMGPLIYLTDKRLYPLALGLFEFRSEFGADFGMLMAASTLMILPVILLFFIAQKYFIQGVTLTGMKN